MEANFSPKQVAEALRVSESSIKRWCDRGAICTTKTHGGHRRITLGGLMEFLEASNRVISLPSVLGIGESSAADKTADTQESDLAEMGRQFDEALVRGDERESRKIFLECYSKFRSLALVSDELIAPSFVRIGERWHASSIEVFQERRACEICVRLIHEFRRLMTEPGSTALTAIGCTTSGDHYSLPGQLIEVVLREAGWRATNMGVGIPLKSLAAAITAERPQLVWLSVSFTPCTTTFVKEMDELWEAIPPETCFVVGGRALKDDLRPRLRYTAHCDTMQQLSKLARTLRSSGLRERSQP